jgi:TolA-binding protein
VDGMNELELIENYFSGNLSASDKQLFESRCESDDAFAKEVSIYILTRQQLRENLRQNKKQEFQQQFNELSRRPEKSGSKQITWFPYLSVAAACVLLIVAYVTYFANSSPGRLADDYIKQNFTTLSVTMGVDEDSLQVGIDAFNRKDFQRAENVFHSLQKNETLSAEATKYLGITYLVQEQYDKAIDQFNILTSYSALYANPGKFYLGITLLKRSDEGDEEKAKQLLKEVIDKRLPGYREASVWMDEL